MRIDYYTSPTGQQPVKDYISSLDIGLRSKTMRSISMLEQFGISLGEPDSKHLEKGIFELRTNMGGNSSRILFFFCIGDTAVLTHGFMKKTQKAPRKEIERAKRYRDEFLKRIREGENCGA